MSAFSLVTATNVFKRKFWKMSDAVFNASTPVWSRLNKNSDFVGKDMFVSNPLSFSGGVGSGSLPTANVGKYEGSIINSKKIYATCQVEREAIKASEQSEGAFVKAMAETVKKTLESFMRNCSRQFFNNGTGILAFGAGAAAATAVTGNGSTATPYLITLTATTFFDANFEERDLVQIGTGATAITGAGASMEATFLEVDSVNPTTFVIGLVGVSARLAVHAGAVSKFATTDIIVMQNSYNNDFMGLRGISEASVAFTGTLYNVPLQRRWSMDVYDASAAAITIDIINKRLLTIERKSGKVPNLIVCGFTQYAKLLALHENQKRYNLQPKDSKYVGQFSFEGLQFMTTAGVIPVIYDRFVHDDEIWLLNDNYITITMRPGGAQWFEEDGTVFLRDTGSDTYSARYGFYGEDYIIPTFHGHIKNLAL
jgi:hypothetical protein